MTTDKTVKNGDSMVWIERGGSGSFHWCCHCSYQEGTGIKRYKGAHYIDDFVAMTDVFFSATTIHFEWGFPPSVDKKKKDKSNPALLKKGVPVEEKASAITQHACRYHDLREAYTDRFD